MFDKTYKSTIKVIIRSPLMWLTFSLFIGVAIYEVLKVHYNVYQPEIARTLTDIDSEFVLPYNLYIQEFENSTLRSLMWYPMPTFAVISVVVVLIGDYRNSFYEIKKAGGIKPFDHCLGQIVALITVNTLVFFLVSFSSLHAYYISRNILSWMSPINYFSETSIRHLRVFWGAGMPGMLLFISVPYAIGNLFKSGWASAISGIVFVLASYLSSYYFSWRMPEAYQYFAPGGHYLYSYMTFYDTQWFNIKKVVNPFSTKDVIICLSILYSISAICIIFSWLSTKKREI